MEVRCVQCEHTWNMDVEREKRCPRCGCEILIDLEAIRRKEVIVMLEGYLFEIEKRRILSKWIT